MGKPVGVIRHINIEGLGSIADVLQQRHINYSYVDAWKDSIPANPSAYSTIVVLGGPMGVYEGNKYPFIEKELMLIKKARDAGIPVIGICFGSQLVAQALGGRVYKGGRKEIGWYKITFTGDALNDAVFAPLISPESSSLRVFQWHGDTFDLPAGAQLLAGSELYPHQAFRIDENIYGLQFHIEVKEADIKTWIEEYKAEIDSLKTTIDAIDVKKMLGDTAEYINTLNKTSIEVFNRFFKYFSTSF